MPKRIVLWTKFWGSYLSLRVVVNCSCFLCFLRKHPSVTPFHFLQSDPRWNDPQFFVAQKYDSSLNFQRHQWYIRTLTCHQLFRNSLICVLSHNFGLFQRILGIFSFIEFDISINEIDPKITNACNIGDRLDLTR